MSSVRKTDRNKNTQSSFYFTLQEVGFRPVVTKYINIGSLWKVIITYN